MGIPKFFRYIAQRWPLISQNVNGSIIPEYDNLYLDMNSILHMCTHANMDNVGHLDDDKVFRDITNYIEHLFTIINPREVFFMAIDGVAPRAKMNQQRSRRFRSAYDAEEQRRKAAAEGVPLDEDPFDSSCITPGTEFMAKLTVYLRYFIARKITEDSRWQACKIVFSGHEVPGEGEHKIMNYIRKARSQPDYNPNTRHCLYGLDADLIMLGLSTHEPHFSLLREEVTFGRKIEFQSNEISEQKFILLHLSLVRDYLELELIDDEFKEPPDFERILDDVILIMFFIGNDFLPELPMLLVNDGAIPVMFNMYKNYLKNSGNIYLSKNGVVDFIALKEWMHHMKQYQKDKFEEQLKISGWFNSQMEAFGKNDDEIVLTLEQYELFSDLKIWMNKVLRKQDDSATLKITDQPKFVQLLCDQTGFKYEDGVIQLDKSKGIDRSESQRILRVYYSARVFDPSQIEEYGNKLLKWKNNYYISKFGDSYDSEIVNHAAEKCLEGLQWVLKYYYDECPSWSWYYDNHYAPMITEIITAIGDGFEPKFELSKPFRPFEQLMSVLPDRSAALLPPVLRRLILEPTSPIKDFYPHEFKLDRNGKKADWESVVLIPFIDEKRLLDHVRPIEENELTESEKLRNSFGAELEFSYDPNESYLYKSPSSKLSDLDACTCSYKKLQFKKYPYVYGRIPTSYSGKNALAGFPTLNTLPYDWKLESGTGVKIFEMPSNNDSIIIYVKPSSENVKVGQKIYVNWPYLHEAKVTKVRQVDSSPILTKALSQITGKHRLLGVQPGKTDFMVGYQELQGLTRQPDGSFLKEFSGPELYTPKQMVVSRISHEDPRFKERKAVPIEEEFPTGSTVLLLLPKFYGFPAKITAHQGRTIDVEAVVTRYRDPVYAISKTIVQQETANIRWWDLQSVAKSLEISVKFLMVITSRLIVNVKGNDVNVALQLRKHGLGLIADGYSRMTYRKEWEFSDRGIALLMSYLKTFGSKLQRAAAAKEPTLDPDTSAKIKEWISKYAKDIKFIPSTSNHMSDRSIKLLEQQLKNMNTIHLQKVVIKHVEVGALLSSNSAHHLLRSQKFKLGDRVVYVMNHGKVPLYSRGVVAGINTGQNSQSTTLDIVWDYEFTAGCTLDGRLESHRGLTISAQHTLNLSNVQLEYVHERNSEITRISARVSTTNSTGTEKKALGDKSRFVPAAPRNDWKQKTYPASSNNTSVPSESSNASQAVPVESMESLQVSSEPSKPKSHKGGAKTNNVRKFKNSHVKSRSDANSDSQKSLKGENHSQNSKPASRTKDASHHRFPKKRQGESSDIKKPIVVELKPGSS